MHRVLLQQQRAAEAAVVGVGVVVTIQMRVWLVAVEGVQHVCAVL